MKKIIIIILICFTYSISFAQLQGLQLIDSLKSELNRAKEDTNHVKILADLSKQYFRFDTKQGIYFGNRALALASDLKWDLGIALSYNNIGINYAVLGDMPTALEYFHKSLDKSIEINDEQGVANLSNNIGNIYRKINKFDKSIIYLKKAIDINLKLKNKVDLYKGFNNLGLTYSMIPNMDSSNIYLTKAIELAEELNNPEFKYQTLVNIANNYISLKQYCKALEISFEAYSICEQYNFDYDKATIAGTIGLTYYEIANDTLTQKIICKLYNFNTIDNLKEAEKYLLVSLGLLQKVNDYNQIMDNAFILSDIYNKLGNYKSSLDYFKIYKTAFDSINFKNNNQKIENLETKREIELRDKQITIQNLEIEKKDAQLLYQVLGFVLTVVVIVIISYIVYYKFKKRKEHETKTVKKIADEAIQESQRMLKLISDNLPKTYIFQFKMDNEGKFSFIYISSGVERVHFGINVDDVLKNADVLLDTIDESLKPAFIENVILSAQTLTDFEMDLMMYGLNGNLIWMNIFSRPRKDSNGVVLWDGTAIDITERKNAENELSIAKAKAEEYEKLKSAFLQNISHEIRTPLNGIVGFTNFLEDDDLDPIEKREFIDMIKNSSKRLELMVDNIIEVSKITTSQINLIKTAFLIENIFEDVYQHKLIYANQKNIKLSLEFNNYGLESIYSDYGKLKLIFNGLVNNAIKFTKNGEVVIGCRKENKYFKFYVKDSGIGIEKELQEKIFDTFFQVDSSISRSYEGAGLGLSICKGLVELLGGKIWVESEVGKGSTFWFSLPY